VRAGEEAPVHRRPPDRRAPLAALIGLALALTPAAAGAAPPVPAPAAADRFLDIRLAQRDRVAATGADTGLAARSPRVAARVQDARDALTDDLGRQGVLETDPLTGSVRQLTKLDGALTTPTGAAPAATARAFARANATALGLDAEDVDALAVAGQERSTSGLTVVRFGQQVDSIPSFDSGLRVAVDRAGRVLSVAGAPRSDLPADVPATPALSAADALQRLMDQTGVHRDVTVTSTAQDARRTTRFSTDDVARLTLFGAKAVRLAWHLTYQATSTRWYDAVVDATTGEVLYRANLVRLVTNANIYRNYPGAPRGGTQEIVDLAAPGLGYLNPGATTLTGPNVHAWADVDDDDQPGPTEEVAPGPYPAATNGSRTSGACDATHLCTWDHTAPTSWTTNRNQNVTQTFWYANRYHDHLAAGPIGFDIASGNFQGSDPLNLNALDGAATAGGAPDADHIDNANMATPPDGQSPKMQMYLFAHSTSPSASQNFRDVNGGDDAAVVYHEYTHGLSSRLITNDDGSQALNSPQSAAMSEGWSDWYAQDFLVREGLETDAPPTDGDIDMGRYIDSIPHSVRHQAVDCAVGSTNAAACPGGGGYTFGDFGRIAAGPGGGTAPEVHADGEIWVQTLWQLRQALVAKLGSESAGSDAAERIITDGMRLSVPEPSYLDMRNAILQADLNAYGGADQDLIWEVFRSRGMGFYAAADDSSDTVPVEDFRAPPAANSPKGTITGTVTDAATGAPLAGVTAGVGGLATDPSFETYLGGTSDGAGRYAIPGVPPGTYPKVGFRSPAGYDRVTAPATVAAGHATPLDARLRRDWAAVAGGARIASTNDDTGAPYGCGAGALIDQSQGAGWSAENHVDAAPERRYVPTVTVELPRAVDVSQYAIDPGNTCGDGPEATLKGYRLETSPDGASWTSSAEGQFALTDAGRLVGVPAAAGGGVKFVRLTLKSPQSAAAGTSGASYIDVSELEVYGAPSGGATTPPAPEPAPAPATPTAPPVLVAPKAAPRFRPTFVVPSTGTKGRVRLKVTCRTACRLGVALTVDARTKRRYRLRSATVGRLATRTVKGTRTLTVALTADARKRLRARHVKKLRVTVRLTATVTTATTPGRTSATKTTKAKTVSLKP
jgi:extracellular elastinolytic metalloproteinase